MGKRIQDLPPDERPRERLLQHGATSLADAEVLAVLVGSGTNGTSAVDLGRALLSEGWEALARKSVAELVKFRGMGPAKAAKLSAALEIGARLRKGSTPHAVHGPEDVAVVLMQEMAQLSQEEFRVVCLNTKHHILAMDTVFVGGLDTVEVFPRDVFRRAVARSAGAIIVAHNHPSGDPEPSQADIGLTRRLAAAGQILGIPLLDHIVVGRYNYCSLKVSGHMRSEW